jgi:hypothetical protein
LNSVYIDADFGSSVTLQDFACVGTNLTTAATLRIQLSTVAPGSQDVLNTGTISAGVLSGYPQVYYSHGSELTARYCRITLADSSLSEIDVGYIYAGPGWRPTRNFAFGLGMRWEDASAVEVAMGGQDLVELGGRFRVAEFDLNNIESEMLDEGFELDRQLGVGSALLLRLDPTNYPVKRSMVGRVQQITPLVLGSHGILSKRYLIKERL